eukprot:6459892-Pyramimonas_sp.AAC.1
MLRGFSSEGPSGYSLLRVCFGPLGVSWGPLEASRGLWGAPWGLPRASWGGELEKNSWMFPGPFRETLTQWQYVGFFAPLWGVGKPKGLTYLTLRMDVAFWGPRGGVFGSLWGRIGDL